jgi:hypothetical protein
MYVTTLVNFHDNLKDVDRKRGEVFVVSRERFEEINAVGEKRIGAPIVEEVQREDQPAKETPEKRAKAARSTRAKGK